MIYNINLSQVETGYLAAVRASVTRQSLGPTIRQILTGNLVYEFIKTAGLQKAGHNVIVYKHDQHEPAGTLPKGFVIEVGVQVSGPFESNGQVICSSTPRGSTVTTLHTGPYDRLGEAHSAIMHWARDQNLPLTGRSWEIYGDWHEDPHQLTTQVFYLLK